MAEYEFTAQQNQSIDHLRQKLVHISIMLVLGGVLLLSVGHIVTDDSRTIWYTVVPAVSFIVLGFVYYRPVDNLKRITTTKGHDILEMMIGMDDLRIAFTTAQVVFVFLIIMAIAEISRQLGF